MAKEQKYKVISNFSGFELRSYEPCTLADIQITADFEKAGNAGFGPLVGYIGGRNQLGAKIAMTAPVIQEPKHETHIVSFVLPSEVEMISAPIPVDSRVTLREVPQELVAVDKFSGRWSEALYQERVGKLISAIKLEGFIADGNPRFARFDPPWTPWFLRRNEIQVPVASLS